jgi:hypothetical protein
MRSAIDRLVLLLALGIVAEGWLTPGLFFPTVVTSGSMAPRLRGPCWIATCENCGVRFAIDQSEASSVSATRCPNCASVVSLSSAIAKQGERLLIDTLSLTLASPRRWERVVVSDPDGSGGLVVKRIVGLPDETIEIRSGDVFANGQRARKSLDDLRNMAIRVNDDRHRSGDIEGRATSRWRPTVADSGWIEDSNGWRRQPPTNTSPRHDWLCYHHRSSAGRQVDSAIDALVSDDYAYNVAESRRLEAVHDLLFRCRLQCSQKGRLAIWISDGRDAFCCVLEIGRVNYAYAEAAPLAAPVTCEDFVVVEQPPEDLSRSALVEFAQVDGQLLLAIDGRTMLRRQYDPSEPRLIPVAPIAISAYGADRLVVTELEILRDVHYLHGQRGEVETRLAGDQYFLLGDNCPVSIDSRNWSTPGVSREKFVGRIAGTLATDRDAW